MPNRYAWIALGLGAYIAFVLSMFPADAAYRWFAPDALRMSGLSGTVWSGRAALASADGLPLRDLRWQLDALPLLIGRANARVQARLADGYVEATVRASFGGRAVLSDVMLQARLAALEPIAPIGDVRGQLRVALDRLELVDGLPASMVGRATLTELTVPTFVPGGRGDPILLGDFALTFDDTGGQGLLARFNDTSGPLAVEGTLTVDRQGRYLLDARAAARRGAPPALVQALELMGGEPGPDGKRPFELSGSL